MNILRVKLTDGAITNGYIHFPLTDSIFSGENYGDPSGEKKGTPVKIVDEFGKEYEDDVRVSGNTGRLRARFGAYFSRAGARAGDFAEISKNPDGTYALRITRSSELSTSPIHTSRTLITETAIEGQHVRATNTILYGPPGTGKTFTTAARAVQLCDGEVPATRHELMQRYSELQKEHRITFVTFHQSYGYEEFVEGLRPQVNAAGQVGYVIRPGIFREICDAARVRQMMKPGLSGKPLEQRTVCKMSLGASWNEDGTKVYQYALENERVLLGWGDNVDFNGCDDQEAIKARLLEEVPNVGKPDSQAWYVNFLKNELKVGDIVVVSNGNKLFRAIAEITGEYEFAEDAPFHQSRPVKWLAVFEPAKPVSEIFHKDFAMQSLYKLNAAGLNYERLDELLSAQSIEPPVQPYVIIIDEINRANISKVFGELITLLEPDKRDGELNAISVKLPYSGKEFSVPANLHVLGTMNTADRSIALLDTALRRRFDFEELSPDPFALHGKIVEGIDLEQLLVALNDRVEALFDRDHRIGHAFFIDVKTMNDLEMTFRRKVIPLLQEYFYENWANVRRALNDYGAGDFVIMSKLQQLPADDEDDRSEEPRVVYCVNDAPFPVSAYQRIYAGK